jgi:uncharacterized protein (DUF1501 family)
VVRGSAPVMSWVPPNVKQATDDTVLRLLDLYNHIDPAMARALQGRMGLISLARAEAMEGEGKPVPPRINNARAYFAEAAGTAAKYLARADGPRVGALAFNGWDTHNNEGVASGLLANLLGALDGAIAAMETNMGAAWSQTMVAIVTEFGRTARINGTDGTDHGSGTVALLVGGALKGGRVIADWPGVKETNLYENRDLKPTTDLRAVLKGLLRDHLRVDKRVLAETVFPGSAKLKPMDGLVVSA